MADLSEQLDEMLQEIGGVVNLTIEEREEITQAGADVLAKNLKQATKDAGHYNANRKVGKMTHLADSVDVGNLDGTKADGSTAVGFNKKDANHARIARFLNDGTRFIQGDSFIDNARANSSEEVLKAQSKVFKRIVEGKRGSS
ncbi:HK97 gp10 family phage protein [Leuconostoc falkenbergense]|uniref:HK97 gp10 family phage protein n=1 Tax=Leuconostoc falkenbergense TaxID=2766470 RepID=UPI0021AAEACC|nr:HK97 gp10 family phage protein [Leuconostoc falkenbergense]MCT4418802.1 HK97 gp10 family phage protein [Leuconostoc falkenbergense]